MPKISIIVPVYNAEAYIRKCIDSLLSQTFSDFEVLLIDDGSPDNSGKICDDCAAIDGRVKVFHKENGGVASARQMGLEHAAGEYIIHADPDDWVEPDMLECMYQKAEIMNADIMVCDYNIVGTNGEIKRINVNLPKDNIACLKKIISGEVHASLCNKLVKRSLYFDNGISFIYGLNMCEDLSVMYRLVYYAKKIAYISEAFYNYVVGRTGSYTSTKMSLAQQKNIMDLICHLETFFKGKEVDEAVYKEITYFKAGTLCKIALYGDLDYYKQTKSIFEDIRFYDVLSQPTIGWRLKICGICLYLKQMYFVYMFRALRKNIKH